MAAGRMGYSVTLPDTWTAGRFWPRTNCVSDSNGFTCQTGNCGKAECAGGGGQRPATLVEFTLSPDTDFYDISLVDGYTVGVKIEPMGYMLVPNPSLGKFNCGSPTCIMDIATCPTELRMAGTRNHNYCMSICAAIGSPIHRASYPMLQHIHNDTDLRNLVCCDCNCGPECGCTNPASKRCCSPYSADPNERGGKCVLEQWPVPSVGNWPNSYAQVFKTQCPDAYSWQFDDMQSTYQCKNADYSITFCP
jgi:hypothetical protein